MDKGYRRASAAEAGHGSNYQAPPPPSPKASEPQKPAGKAPTPGVANKQYRIYGRKGGSVVHTRIGGKVYTPPQGFRSRFNNGDKVNVGVGSDGRASINDPRDSKYTQTWNPSNEAVQRIVNEMIAEYLGDRIAKTVLNEDAN